MVQLEVIFVDPNAFEHMYRLYVNKNFYQICVASLPLFTKLINNAHIKTIRNKQLKNTKN